MIEIWQNLDGIYSDYSISNLGNVKNKYGNILKSQDNKGYRRITFAKIVNGKRIKKSFLIHRLVAKYFVDGYDEELTVNHKDGNKINNIYYNLEWVTNLQNMRHSWDIGLRKKVFNENHHRTTVSSEVVRSIREMHKQGYTNKYITDKYNLRPRYVSEIVRNKRRLEA